MSPLKDQIAVVTGASRGIGRAIALRLVRAGAQVCLVGRDAKSLEDVARSTRDSSAQASIYRADLTLDGDVRALASEIAEKFATLDILVHCAGTVHHGRVEDTPVEHFDEQYKSNVRAPYLLTQALLPALKKQKGQIVFINSSITLNIRAGTAQYSATKHALKALADCLREEINADGVRVLSIFPGRTATPGLEYLCTLEGKEYHPQLLLQPEDVAESIIAAISLPRTAEVTNIHLRPALKSY